MKCSLEYFSIGNIWLSSIAAAVAFAEIIRPSDTMRVNLATYRKAHVAVPLSSHFTTFFSASSTCLRTQFAVFHVGIFFTFFSTLVLLFVSKNRLLCYRLLFHLMAMSMLDLNYHYHPLPESVDIGMKR